MSKLARDLPPEIRDQETLIMDGLVDEIEALEELAERQEEKEDGAPGGIPKTPSDQAEPAPETL